MLAASRKAFSCRTEARDGHTLLVLEGYIGEDADLERRASGLIGPVVIDLGGVDRINSRGLYVWIKFISALCARADVLLVQCTPVMMQQFHWVDDALGKARIGSMLLPYFCDSCKSDSTKMLEVGQGPSEIPDVLPCPKCGGEMSFNDVKEVYTFGTDDELKPDPLIGTILDGEYELVEHLGTGALSSVYRAKQLQCMGRSVAVKLLSPSFLDDESIKQRFRNEAQAISALRHPNTVKLIDFGQMANGRMYIVTEFLSGETLAQRLKRGPLSAAATIRLLVQVADSLREAHAAGIIHRDLKPSNLFIEDVGGQEFVKVLDFGLAKVAPGAAPQSWSGAMFGTPAYMAPEQASGATVDPRADLYAAGIIAYESLLGRPAFQAPTPEALMFEQINSEPPAIHRVRQDVPEKLGALVMKLLAKNPNARFQTASELRVAIAAIDRRNALDLLRAW